MWFLLIFFVSERPKCLNCVKIHETCQTQWNFVDGFEWLPDGEAAPFVLRPEDTKSLNQFVFSGPIPAFFFFFFLRDIEGEREGGRIPVI